MFDSIRAVLCATMTILAGGATVSAGTIIEIPQYQRVQISWSGSTGCHSASWWHQPTAMHGGWCTLNTLTYTYSGKRVSMWSFDLSGIPADAEITSLAIRVSGGEGYYSAEGQLFNLGLTSNERRFHPLHLPGSSALKNSRQLVRWIRLRSKDSTAVMAIVIAHSVVVTTRSTGLTAGYKGDVLTDTVGVRSSVHGLQLQRKRKRSGL